MNNHDISIQYDRTTRDFSVTVNGEYLGSARNYSEGEILTSNYIGELEALAAQAIEPKFCVISVEAQLAAQGLRRASTDERGWYVIAEEGYCPVKVWATDEPALPHPIQNFLDTLDEAPELPAIFTATSAKPMDAMLQALSQAECLINRLGDEVISQTDEVTVSVCGQPLTTVVVVVAPRVAVEAAPIHAEAA
jgi:hypothetical protein